MLGLTKNIAKDFKSFIINPPDTIKSVLNNCERISDSNTMVFNDILKQPSLDLKDKLYLSKAKDNKVLQYPMEKTNYMDLLFSKYEQLLTCLYEFALLYLPEETKTSLIGSCLTSQIQYKGRTATVRMHIEYELKRKISKTGDVSCKDFSTLLSQCYTLRNSIIHDYYPTHYCRYIVICSFLGVINKLIKCEFLKSKFDDGNLPRELFNFK